MFRKMRRQILPKPIVNINERLLVQSSSPPVVYSPAMNFSDARNSMFLALLLEDF